MAAGPSGPHSQLEVGNTREEDFWGESWWFFRFEARSS
ncbi:GSCOCG00000706001-RA-CDS [Cotesia congregata]|nr:GSCOCG00000706001-RA-CDS [Cotesia congregata]